jgi:hypothetical protein
MNRDIELERLIAKIRRACRTDQLQQRSQEECRRRYYQMFKERQPEVEHER